jgi:hydrogenase-1 operon protein HyaE
MNASIAWKPPRSAISNNFSALLDKLVAKHGITELDQAGLQSFMDEPGNAVALLTDEPDTAPESWDLAVIFPELIAATGASLRTAVLRPESSRLVQTRFGLGRLPALLFLRDGGYVGAIEGIRDWSEFVAECKTLLEKPASRIPIGIAVSVVTPSSCH